MPNTSRLIQPVSAPLIGSIQPPGSKSLTNRALPIAALAKGTSTLTGVLESDDTAVMLQSLRQLGLVVAHDPQAHSVVIEGCENSIPKPSAVLNLNNSGTSIRFLTAMCCLGNGTYRLDGNARMRERPIGDLVSALAQHNVKIRCELNNECPPVEIVANGLQGGVMKVRGNISSQYLSAILMAAPAAQAPLTIQLEGELVSIPYIEMTLKVMEAFGVTVQNEDFKQFHIQPQQYSATQYAIEPDASAASYFFAAAAITGGKVKVNGLHKQALQGDIHFVSALEQMGCEVNWRDDAVEVIGKPLKGIDIDMNAISDTAQTLAAVAIFAEGPTRVRNVAHMRHKETDRVSAVVTELKRMQIEVTEHEDGFTIIPGNPQPAKIETYDDHRMAMSFALVGLKAPGIEILDPECTGKTYPHFFEDLELLCKNSA